MWLGAIDAGRKSLEDAIDRKDSIFLWPGGSKEIFLTDCEEKETKLYVKQRKGFVKLALRKGTPIVPVVVFGEQRYVLRD